LVSERVIESVTEIPQQQKREGSDKKIERRSVTESKVGYQTIHKSICSKPTPREKKILEISMNDNKKRKSNICFYTRNCFNSSY
jgi:hypothetical protein